MNTALSTTNGHAGQIVGGDDWKLAEAFTRSGFFSDARDVAQAIVKIQAGRELGFGPMASMQGVYIVKGKVSLSANMLGAAIKRSGRYDYRVTEMSDERVAIDFLQAGEVIGSSEFTMADAKRAGLLGSQTWKSYPRNMLFARALSNGARWFCPDVFGGPLYTPEELGAEVDEDGDPVTVEVSVRRPADQPAPDPEPHYTERIESAKSVLELVAMTGEIRELTNTHHRTNSLAMAMLRAIELSTTPDDLAMVRDVYGEMGGALNGRKAEVIAAAKAKADEIEPATEDVVDAETADAADMAVLTEEVPL